MKLIQLNWETGEILEKGVLSKEFSNEIWIETYSKINAEFKKQGINKVWLLEVLK